MERINTPENPSRKEEMKNTFLVIFGLLLSSGVCAGRRSVNLHAYVDSTCVHLMLGPITSSRVECSQKTNKEGSNPVLVRLKDNTAFDVNKQKMVKDYVGKFAEVTGEAKLKSGTMNLQSVKPEPSENIPQGDPGRRLLDVRMFKTQGGAKTAEKVRHELAMMPYITVYDFISFTMVGDNVILTGWTVRQTNRSEAYNRVKSIEGVAGIVNNIEVLPMGRTDMQIRAGARARLQRMLGRYFWGSGSDIKIVVKNGNIILLGSVASKADSDIANIQCSTVPFAFHVFNMLRVQQSADTKKS
jgi:osmotically-inducible protein OsmY